MQLRRPGEEESFSSQRGKQTRRDKRPLAPQQRCQESPGQPGVVYSGLSIIPSLSRPAEHTVIGATQSSSLHARFFAVYREFLPRRRGRATGSDNGRGSLVNINLPQPSTGSDRFDTRKLETRRTDSIFSFWSCNSSAWARLSVGVARSRSRLSAIDIGI